MVERVIRNFHVPLYVVDFLVGASPVPLADSAYRALIEPDFEPKF
jgi:hypothetical protein